MLRPTSMRSNAKPPRASRPQSERGSIRSCSTALRLGKTEVYFEAIAECLRQGKQALVLLPEIALTEPFLKRFEARFGCAPVAWHSGLRSSERRRAWRGIASGEAKVTVGARSALFLPYRELGLIVIDEAHEPTFKQEDGVQYHARDTAVMRGLFEQVPVILSSATPAIESRHMVEVGRYREVSLPQRFAVLTARRPFLLV